MSTITVAERFCGPPGSGNGGYFAGLMAASRDATLSVRLQQPIPLNSPLQLTRAHDGSLRCEHHGELIATARVQPLELTVPQAPDYLQALEASRHFIGFAHHSFPGCFVCGTARARGDGLRIFAGSLAGRELVAAPWVPDADLGDADGKVRAEFMSAALDCPGYFAARDDGVAMLLGQFNAHIDRCVHIEEPCVLIGWRIARSGRKCEVGTALFDDDGNLCARAAAVWIEPRAAR